MKNLHYHFNTGAKSETRVQSGFQGFAYYETVSVWENIS